MMRYLMVFSLLSSILISITSAKVLSQWRGSERTGVYPNEPLLKEWPSQGPKLLWVAENLGTGYSSAAVTSDRVYITGMVDGTGYLIALDMNGKQIWKSSYGPEWEGGRPGSRSTPTVMDDKIYLMSAEGRVVCFNAGDGKIIWSVDLIEKFRARNLRWGMTESLLINGDRLFCTPGGPNVMMAILNRHNGKTLKEINGNGETSAYCSPAIISHGNGRLLLTMTGESLIALNADSEKYLWRKIHRTRHDINPNTPLYNNGYVYSVSGYGTGGQLFKLSPDGSSAELVWRQETLDSQFGAAILVDGYIYGSGHNNRGWHCIDWNTGKVQYTEKVLGGKGNIIYCDGMLYCYSEKGDVALVKPNSKKFEVISSFKINQGSGEHWAHPVISNGRLYVRHGDALMVYNIAK